MTPDNVSAQLRAQRSQPSGRGRDCPDEHTVAAYVDAALPVAPRHAFEAHMVDCDHCLALVGLLSRAREAAPAAVPEDAPLRRGSPGPSARATPRWAAAAGLALAVFGVWQLTAPSVRVPDAEGIANVRSIRGADARSADLRLLSPTDGATLQRSASAVRWSAVAGAQGYDVRVVNDAGDVVSEARVVGTAWQLPNPERLKPGVDYFVHVDALLIGDKTVSSPHVAFRVAE